MFLVCTMLTIIIIKKVKKNYLRPSIWNRSLVLQSAFLSVMKIVMIFFIYIPIIYKCTFHKLLLIMSQLSFCK